MQIVVLASTFMSYRNPPDAKVPLKGTLPKVYWTIEIKVKIVLFFFGFIINFCVSEIPTIPWLEKVKKEINSVKLATNYNPLFSEIPYLWEKSLKGTVKIIGFLPYHIETHFLF